MPPIVLSLLSSMAAREVLRELAVEYERAGGAPINAQAAGGVDVAKRVQAGEAVDIVVLADAAIDKLIAEGKLLAGSRVDIAKSGIAMAVRVGAKQPDVSTEQAVKQAVQSAATVSYSTGPSGVYLEKLFARWGILETIRDRIVVPPPGVPVGSLVAAGQVELGFQQLSELLNLAGIQVAGTLPPSIQSVTTFSGAIGAKSEQTEACRAVLAFMASDRSAATKHRFGMDSA